MFARSRAIGDDGAVARDFIQTRFDLAKRDVMRASDLRINPGAHVYDEGRRGAGHERLELRECDARHAVRLRRNLRRRKCRARDERRDQIERKIFLSHANSISIVLTRNMITPFRRRANYQRASSASILAARMKSLSLRPAIACV